MGMNTVHDCTSTLFGDGDDQRQHHQHHDLQQNQQQIQKNEDSSAVPGAAQAPGNSPGKRPWDETIEC